MCIFAKDSILCASTSYGNIQNLRHINSGIKDITGHYIDSQNNFTLFAGNKMMNIVNGAIKSRKTFNHQIKSVVDYLYYNDDEYVLEDKHLFISKDKTNYLSAANELKESALSAILNLENIGKNVNVNDVFYAGTNKFLIGTDTGLYTTQDTYAISSNFRAYSITDINMLIINNISSQIEQHINAYHNNKSLLTYINDNI